MNAPASLTSFIEWRLQHILAVASLCLAAASAAFGAQKPNLVLIVADDLGQRDPGCYGSTFYETPNLDRLAQEGCCFTDAYAACPLCSPTRASIMTGKYPQRTGITDYLIAPPLQPKNLKQNTRLLSAPHQDRLAHTEFTLAEALKRGGYATFFAGKWHLGPEGWWPEDQGFDINQGGIDRGGPYGGNRYFSPYGNPRLKDGPPGGHLPDRLATETATFMEAHQNRPFFVCLSFYDVHTPLMARADLQEKYERKRSQMKLQAAWNREGNVQVRLVQEHAVYAGMVEAMDLAIGKVLAKLDELNLSDETLVVFTSDNGGYSTGEGAATSNVPLRAGKGWLYEGGIRVPLLIRWPGVTEPGQVIHQPVISNDFYPTLLGAAGVPLPADYPGDGVEIASVIKTNADTAPSRTLFWHYPHYIHLGSTPCTAVRRGDWKLIHWFEDDRYELFNLKEDLSERNDLAETHTQQLAELKEEMERMHKVTGSLNPTPNPNYKPHPQRG